MKYGLDEPKLIHKKPKKKMDPESEANILTGLWMAFVFGFIMYSIPKTVMWIDNPNTFASKLGKTIGALLAAPLIIYWAYKLWDWGYDKVVSRRWKQ